MDEMVLKAMAKWPNVPSCVGWLGLDGRGDWYMRDEQVQAQGPFVQSSSLEPSAKGTRLVNEKLVAFIGRNYTVDSHGCWYFQNGPQRVYVELECAPWVWRVQQADPMQVEAHTGALATVQGTVLDELGRLYVATELGIGLVHTQYMVAAANLLEAGFWPHPEEVQLKDLPGRYHCVLSPKAREQAKASSIKA